MWRSLRGIFWWPAREGKGGDADLGAQIELSARSTGKTGLLRELRSMVESPEDEGKGKDIVGGREGEKSAVARIPHQISTLSQMHVGRPWIEPYAYQGIIYYNNMHKYQGR